MSVYLKLKFIIPFLMVTTLFLEALPLDEKYPSYSYVFNEFDVDFGYINNKEFISFVKKREKGLRRFYNRSLKKGKKILPKLQGMLLEDGVSDLFTYLSMVESGFSSKIVSSKKAVGLWQFMPATARHYKLKVDKKCDERCNIKRSTTAAINYLTKLHKQFGKWYLAAMAYNCGEGRLQRAIKKAKSDNIEVLTNNRLKYLPKETREYIQKILLISMIGENITLGFVEPEEESFPNSIEVEISQNTTLLEIAKLLNLKLNVLQKINKHKTKNKIFIPSDKVYAFYLRYEDEITKAIIKPKELNTFMLMYTVNMGDTLEKIAKKYHTTIESIKTTNHLEDDFLVLHSTLVILVDKEFFDKLSS